MAPKPAMEAVFTIEPLAALRAGAAAFEHLKTLIRLTLRRCAQSSSVMPSRSLIGNRNLDARYSCVVDEQVEAAKLRDGIEHHGFGLSGIAEITWRAYDVEPLLPEFRESHLAARVRRQIVDCDLRAGFRH